MKRISCVMLLAILPIILAGCNDINIADNSGNTDFDDAAGAIVHDLDSNNYDQDDSLIDEIPIVYPEPTMTESASLLDLVGTWVISHATDEMGEEVELPYRDWLPWTLEIRADSTFVWTVYGRLSGDLTYAGDGSFTGVNLVAWAEGETWYPEDDEIIISHDPQSGLLRYTRVFEGSPYIQHFYYAAWTTVTAWYESVSVDMPSAWYVYEIAPDAGVDPFGFLRTSGEGSDGRPIDIRFYQSPISQPSMILYWFTYQEQFVFNDGTSGYMAEDSERFVWIYDGVRGIVDIYLHHGGNREIFTYNEEAILCIIRSFRYNPQQ